MSAGIAPGASPVSCSRVLRWPQGVRRPLRALVGDAAPPAVQASLGGVDEGMPPDLRLNPDVANARSVAVDGDAVLYAADLPGGGVCTEIATAGKPNGAVCRTSTQPPAPIDATIPGNARGCIRRAGRGRRPREP